MKKVVILCADKNSSYFQCPEALIYTARENALTYNGTLPAICHPPCAVFSRTRNLAASSAQAYHLAEHCLTIVNRNSGIIEQPAHSVMFDFLGIKPTIEIWQSWFGFRARKETWLYCKDITLLPPPISFDTPSHSVEKLTSTMRSRQTLAFSRWLIDSVITTARNRQIIGQ